MGQRLQDDKAQGGQQGRLGVVAGPGGVGRDVQGMRGAHDGRGQLAIARAGGQAVHKAAVHFHIGQGQLVQLFDGRELFGQALHAHSRALAAAISHKARTVS